MTAMINTRFMSSVSIERSKLEERYALKLNKQLHPMG